MLGPLRRLHNSADDLRRRGFHGLRRRLSLRDLSLHHHSDIDNLVDVLNLRELGMLGHLVDKRSVGAPAALRSTADT